MKIANPLKEKASLPTHRTRYAMLLFAGCLIAPISSRAADTWSLPNGSIGTVNWQNASWSKNSIAAPGLYPGSPGGLASDLIITNGSGDGSIGTIHTNGSHTIGGFEKQGALGLTIRAYISDSTATAQSDVLTISGTLKVSSGSLNLRSRKSNQTLSVSAAVAEVASSATLNLGSADTPFGSAAFKSTSVAESGSLMIHHVSTVNLGAVTQNGVLSLANTVSAAASATTVTVDSLSGSGTITSGTSNYSITLALTGSNASAKSFSGVIENTSTAFAATVGVSKSGTGVQIFSGANTYSGGTVISGGGLVVANETGSGLGSGAVKVEAGGTLGGSGIVASGSSIQAQSGGFVAPGIGANDAGVTLRLSGQNNGTAPILTMLAGAEFRFNLASGNVTDSIDFLFYSEGDLVLDGINGTAVNVTGIQSGVYRLFSFSALSSTEGNTLVEQLRLGSGFAGFEQSNFFYLNNAIHLNAVPEPSMLALVAAGVAGIGWWRRQRNSR